MGVNYTALLYLGREFDSEEEAKEFYLEYIPVTDEEARVIAEDGLEEFLSFHPALSGTKTNYYTNKSTFVLGFDLRQWVRHAHLLPNIINDKVEQWRAMFGGEKYDIILTVKVW